MKRNDSEFCYVHSSGYPEANYCMSLGPSVAFQARPCAPTTWRTSPLRSLVVSRSRSRQSRPGRPYPKRKFLSPGIHQCSFFVVCFFFTSPKLLGSSSRSANSALNNNAIVLFHQRWQLGFCDMAPWHQLQSWIFTIDLGRYYVGLINKSWSHWAIHFE